MSYAALWVKFVIRIIFCIIFEAEPAVFFRVGSRQLLKLLEGGQRPLFFYTAVVWGILIKRSL